jgi:hypothetical protein
MEYLVGERVYHLHYAELKSDFHRYHDMGDVEFVENLPAVLHFACIVSYLKEVPAHVLVNDEGVIHQLAHLLDPSSRADSLHRLKEIRETFATVCRLD